MAEAVARTVLDTISQGHLECPICCDRFKDPKILDCLHSFCLNCLGKMVSKVTTERAKITCPVCRRETVVPEEGVQSLSSSFFLISLVDEISKQEQLLGKVTTTSATCESCEDGSEAVSRCLDCKENICMKCREAHQFLRSTKHHRIIQADDLDKSTASPTDATKTATPKCRKHSDHDVCFHCETCDALICAMCAATEHRTAEHKFIGIGDTIKSFRESVKDILQKFQKSKKQFASNQDSIKHARNRLQTKLAQACSDISAKADAEIAKIRSKAKVITEKVNKIGQERDSEYEKALRRNHEQIKRADQIVTAVNDLMSQVDDFELLELRPKVMDNLEFQKELKCESAKVDLSFIGVKCQDVVSEKDLGKMLLKEKWKVKEEFGKEGNNDGEFLNARGVACFSNGDIAVTDTRLNRLSLFTSTGRFKTSAAQSGHQLDAPWHLAVTSEDLLFVTDNKKVKVFDKELQFVREFTPSVDNAESNLTGIGLSEQQVAVVDNGRKVISVHNLEGSLIASISNNMVQYALAISSREQLFFTNYEEKRLLCVNFQGNEVFNVTPLLSGEPVSPTGVLCDDDGSFYVAVHPVIEDTEVQHFDSSGAFIATVAQGLYNPIGMAFTPSGDVTVADKFSVKIFERM